MPVKVRHMWSKSPLARWTSAEQHGGAKRCTDVEGHPRQHHLFTHLMPHTEKETQDNAFRPDS